MTNVRTNKDTSIELIRIIACLIVIGVHIKLSNFTPNNNLDLDCLFISCLLGDGVALFWLITGFFLFNNNSYTKKIRSLITHIIVPTCLYIIVAQLVKDWITTPHLFPMNCNINNINILEIITGFASLNPSAFTYGAHLWYILIYCIIILMFPFLLCICNDHSIVAHGRKYILGMSFVLLAINDLQKIVSFPVPIYSFSFVEPWALFIIIGYSLNIYKDKLKNNKYTILFLIAFFILNAIRTIFQTKLFEIDVTNDYFVYYYSLFGFACSISLFCAIYSININNAIMQNIICFIGKHTFGIYLIHLLVFTKLNNMGVRTQIYNFNKGDAGSFINHLLFTLEYTLLVFVISFFITFIIQKIKKTLLIIMQRKETTK